MSYPTLTSAQVAIAAALILVNGAISFWLRLRLEKSLALAALRMVVQLMILARILNWVFALDRWISVLAIASVMTLIAGVTATRRCQRAYPFMLLDTVAAVWLSSWCVTGYAMTVVLTAVERWYEPRYLIPFVGMVLGNTLNGISIGLSTFTDAAYRESNEIDAMLSLGATRWEACRSPVQNAIRTGMTPIINSMMIVGLVSLPGMMTGQLLAGAEPGDAVKYQIVIIFLIASATALGTTSAVLLAFRRLFNSDHQFLKSAMRIRKA